MKAYEVIEELFKFAEDKDYSTTCDTLKAGDPNREVNKVALSMFATPEVVRKAKEWGAQMLIVHEPTYYNHHDYHSDEKLECEKRKLIEDSGLVIYRYHDYPHNTIPDVICEGEVREFGLKAKVEYPDIIDLVRLQLDEPMTPVELAKVIEERCNIKHMRICGTRDKKCTNVSVMPGTPGGVFDELKREETEILLTGEACEWALGEYARDASQLGYKKALIIMGHIGSERDGMKLAKDMLKKACPDIEAEYFECGEVYSYTDS